MPKGDREILKADPEDGTTPVANLLLEALAMAHLSGQEKGAVLFLWRRTYGWVAEDRRKVWDEITLKEWALALNTHSRYACKIIAGLVEKKILLRRDMGKGKGYLYTTNTRVKEWNRGCLNAQGLYKIYSGGLSKSINQPLSKRSNQELSKTLPLSDTTLASPKEILNKVLKKDIKKGSRSPQYIDLENYGMTIKKSPDAWNREVVENAKYSAEYIAKLSPPIRQLVLAFLEEQAPASPKITKIKQLVGIRG